MQRIFVTLLLAAAFAAHACNDHELQQPNSALHVVNTAVSTAKADGPMLVTVIGELKNTTTDKIDNLVLEAKLTDASGKVIDVLSEPMYGLVVPSGEQVSFRLQGAAATTQATYANAQVRVVSAEAHAASVNKSPNNGGRRIWELAVSWGPMLLIIVVWIVLARKYSGKGSNQDKMLSAINEQNMLLSRQSAAIESIAAALSAGKNND